MITSILDGCLLNLTQALPHIGFALKYPDAPMPYPLKNTIVTLGVKGAKIGHNSLCAAKRFNIDLTLCVDIHSKCAEDCYTAFDSLYLCLMDEDSSYPFSSLEMQDITYDSTTSVFTLPILAQLKLNTEEDSK